MPISEFQKMNPLLIAASQHTGGKQALVALSARFRIFIDAIGSGPYAQMHEVEIYNSRGTNLLSSGVTATHSSSYDSNSFGANKLVGGSGASDQQRWISQENMQNGSWVAFDRGTAEEAVSFAIGSYDFNTQRLPRDFKFQISNDGIIWHTVKEFTNQINWGASETRVFDLTT